MSDFVAFSEEIDNGMECLEHHGILNQRWGHRNGPPYPLGSGAHSAGEKSAAKAAGIKVGKSSGKGSIDEINFSGSRSKSAKKVKKQLTPEEKREKALEAARSGDKKKIVKNVNELSTDELRDAAERARIKDQLTREDPNDRKMSKADMEKMEAIRSGDKEKVKQYADQMSYQELAEAMNRIDLNAKLNYVEPPKSAMDKLSDFANKVDQFRVAAEKGISMYNVAAKVYNSTHKDGAQWPEIHPANNQQKSKEQNVAEGLMKQAMNDVKKGVQETKQQQQEKSYKELSKERLKNAKEDYKNQKKYEEWVAKQERDKKDIAELNNKVEQKRQQEEAQPQQSQPQQQVQQTQPQQQEKQRKYYPERAPKLATKQTESKNTEPTEEQKRLVEQNRKSDEYYLKQINNLSNRKMSDYDNTPSYDDLFSESYKESQRNTSFQKAMEEYDYEDWKDSIRWSDI